MTTYIIAPVTQSDVIHIFHVYIYSFAHFLSLFSTDTDSLVKTIFLSVLTVGFWMTTSLSFGDFFLVELLAPSHCAFALQLSAPLTMRTSQGMTYLSKETAVVKTYSGYVCHEFVHGQYVLWILLQFIFHTDDSYELAFVRQTQSHQFPLQSLTLAQSVGLNSSLKKLDCKIHPSQKQVYLMVVKNNENLKALITHFCCFEKLDMLFCIVTSSVPCSC